MGTAPAMQPAHTVLAFRTPIGGVSIPAGQSKEPGVVDVSAYERIHVVADERIGSGSGVNIRMTITEGSELVAQLDVLSLTHHSQITRIYDVPYNKLTVFADATGTKGTTASTCLSTATRISRNLQIWARGSEL